MGGSIDATFRLMNLPARSARRRRLDPVILFRGALCSAQLDLNPSERRYYHGPNAKVMPKHQKQGFVSI
jgi:hypothetical protein